MGEIADSIIDGEMCAECGEFFEDGDSPGYPRSCCSTPRRKKKTKKKTNRVTYTEVKKTSIVHTNQPAPLSFLTRLRRFFKGESNG